MKNYPIFLLSLAAACLLIPSVQAQEKIKIGVSTPLTGDAATYGVDTKNILQFANEKLAGNAYELVFEDDRCNGRDAVAVAHRLVDVVKVKYVLGFPCSGALLPSAPIYEKAKVLVIALGASAAAISNSGDYIFRTWPSDTLAVQKLYTYIASKHQRLGILSEETDYAQAFLKSLIELNADGKLQVDSESYVPSERDYRSMLLRLKAKGDQAFLLNSQTEGTAAAILKDFKAMKWDVPIYNGFLAASPAFLKLVGAMANGIVFPDYPPAQEAYGVEGNTLLSEFIAKYGKLNSVDMTFSTGIESFRALHEAIKSGEDARTFLYKTRFKGVFGEWYFDKNGDIQGLTPVLKVIENQAAVSLPQ
ncbi:MAG: ABC transporter substrate-binding protein [Deltaproteobacteria bacterium]|nr:ABC transporter substrate-binding protein [Deltaproteobacteria bacterium]